MAPYDTEPSPDLSGDDGPLVAFDFDGTLTVRDSFTAFLRWRTRDMTGAARWASLAPAALAYLAHRDRGRLKSATVTALLQGIPRKTLTCETRAFASAAFETLIRPDALERWRMHQAAGAYMAIITASPEEIVAPFAERLGADVLIGSRLAWSANDRVGGGLDGANCRGEEKVARLIAQLGGRARPAVAYGDTDGDREMLAFAERGEMGAFSARPQARKSRGPLTSGSNPARRNRSAHG